MTKILNLALKIKGGGREGGTCEVLRPCHPPKIWNVHQNGQSNQLTLCIRVPFFSKFLGHLPQGINSCLSGLRTLPRNANTVAPQLTPSQGGGKSAYSYYNSKLYRVSKNLVTR